MPPVIKSAAPRHAHPAALFAALLTLVAWAAPVLAQPYPNHAVRIVVPYGPGTAPDTLARVVGDALSKRLNQPFVIDNKAGAGGRLGTEVAATSAPNGYTLFLASKDTQSVLSHLYPSWTIKPQRQLVPIAGIAKIQNVIVTRKAATTANLADLVALAKTKEVSYGTPGIGTNLHLLAEYVNARNNVKMLHVPYSRSFSEGFPTVMRGEIDLLVAGLPPMLPMIRDGRLKAIAITGTTRSKYVPDVQTFKEAGIPDLDTGGWFALFAPTGTPQPILDLLEAEMAEVLKSPEVLARLEGQASEPLIATPAELNALVAAESARWEKIITDNQIKAE